MRQFRFFHAGDLSFRFREMLRHCHARQHVPHVRLHHFLAVVLGRMVTWTLAMTVPEAEELRVERMTLEYLKVV